MEIVKEIKYVFRCGVRQYRKMEQRKEIGINNGKNSSKLYKYMSSKGAKHVLENM
jgi:hypothetical protein